MTKPSRTAFQSRTGSTLAMLALLLAAFGTVSSARADIAPNAPSGSAAPVNNGAVRQYVNDAGKAMKNGNPHLAVILLKNALKIAPGDGAVRAQLGYADLQFGDLVSAERELRQAQADGAPDRLVLPVLFQTMLLRHEEQKLLSEFPDPGLNAAGPGPADLLKVRAMALQALGNASDAAAAMDHSLALRRDAPGLIARARLAQKQNNLPLAKSLGDEALKLAPKSPEALLFKLGLLMLGNDRVGALTLANQLIQQFPDNLSLRIARIELSIQLKQDSHASADVDALLAKSPNSPIVLYYKALLLARANDIKGAWHIAQSLPPDFVQSQPTIAIITSQMAISSGNEETGAAILNSVLAKSPGLVDVRLRLAALRLRQNSPEAALGVLQPLKDSNDARSLALLSQAYLSLHQYSNALDALGRLNAAGTGGAGVKRELALVEMQSGQSDQAIKDLIELDAKQPTDPTVVAPLVAALSQAKRYAEALAAADRLGADPKQRVQALFFRGQILVLQGDGNGALAAFQSALKLNPRYIAALYYRAGLFEVQKRYADADRDLQTILQVDPKNILALVKRAEVAARQNQDANARAILTRAIGIAPQDPAPRTALIKYLIIRRDLKAAMAAASDLVRVAPKNIEGLTLLGQLQLAFGQKAQSLVTLRRLSALAPKSSNAQLLLANALFANGDNTGASSALSIAAASDPNSISVRSAQIGMMFASNDIGGAIASARAFQTANPGIEADLLLARTFMKAKELSQAAAVLTQSMSVKPDRRALSLLADIAVTTGDKKRAANLLSDWLARNQSDVAIRAQYATVLLQDGDKVRATAQFEAVLRQDPKSIAALNNLAWLLQKDDPKRAYQLAATAYKLYPGAADVADTFGWIKFQSKDLKGALELLNRAHALRPKDGEITYHLVLAVDASGNRNSARGLLKALLDSGVKFDDIVDALKLSVAWH